MAKNGVDYYTKGTVTVNVSFPEDKIACQWCPLFLRYEKDYTRYSCRLTHEWLLYPFTRVGELCPIVIENKGE